ncbi:uncharacterized protein LOC111903469 [Lactuca sativa]|uniref:uncharacterized protein LOC111903469 n=1 Tax=Lactuca sativa TaxID=4236 RepID=UPI000CD82D66|nr:uncharacterized protein LOC111903469 [Lactuca sativa]
MGYLALLSKGKNITEDEEELDLAEHDLTNEDYALIVSNPKNFICRKFPTNKNQNWQGSYSSEKVKEKEKTSPQQDEPKKESKMSGDSGFNCHFCGGKNHFAKDCVLRKMTEKNDNEDDEAYHLRKLEEIKKKKVVANNNTMNALIVQENLMDDEFGKKIQSTILPFLELKNDEIDADVYNCEAVKFNSLNAKLSLENKIDVENAFEFDENDDLSEIYVEDEVDCSEFVKSEPELVKNLISENFVEFALTGVTQKQTLELTTLLNEDNDEGCDEFFWSAPIDNADETVGLSEITSWRVKGRYVAEPLNKPTHFDVPSTSDTKNFLSEPVKATSVTSSLKSETHIKRLNPKVIHEEQFNNEWYIDSGCSRHMTGWREKLREFRALKDGACVKYGNNSFGTITVYGMITNREFSIYKVAYVEGLHHNLISVSQMVVGTGLKVSFDDEGSEIVEKKTNNVLLKSKRK